MQHDFEKLEQRRLILQAALDEKKTPLERNKMGQFATPPGLAEDIMRYAHNLLPDRQPVRFLDPAVGTGSFYSALRSVYPNGRVSEAVGFEIDPHYGQPAQTLWSKTGLSVHIADFTKQRADPRFNLLICNPPYVRHQHLTSDEKERLQFLSEQNYGLRLSGLAGLYCHFLGISLGWMSKGGLAGWLIPSEFMDVNYGKAVRQFLIEKVKLLHIHRFDPSDVQFADGLVSSAIVWFQNTPPKPDHSVKFSFGGTLFDPAVVRTISARALADEPKWTRFPKSEIRLHSSTPSLSAFFRITRGIATGDNSFFILPKEEIAERGLPLQAFRPILPSPRYITKNEIKADAAGNPLIDRRLLLLDPGMSEQEIKLRWPKLWDYLQEGKARNVHKRYLCQHRSVWYAQENRPPAPIVCTYLGRSDTKSGRPFRFILNRSQATVGNTYLAMYPTPVLADAMSRDAGLLRKVWQLLNQIAPEEMTGEGRVYGGGLHKLEPKELGNVPVAAVANLLHLTPNATVSTPKIVRHTFAEVC